MRCEEATRAIVRVLFGSDDAQGRSLLEEHLRTCHACMKRLKAYGEVRDEVMRLKPSPLPDEVTQLLLDRARGAAASQGRASAAPARPEPERSSVHKALIVGGGLLLLLAMMVGLMLVSRKVDRPRPVLGKLVMTSGQVELQMPGVSSWEIVEREAALLQGTAVRTGPLGLAKVKSAGAEWWLDEMSALQLVDGRTAELLHGRAHVLCEPSDAGPVRLLSGNGTVSSSDGSFLAALSLTRLRVGCVSGSALAEHEGEPSILRPGEQAMMAQGQLVGPVRTGRPGALGHWLRKLEGPEWQKRLSQRQLASLPFAADSPALPAGVKVDGLKAAILVRGPLALVRMRVHIRNEAASEWRGVVGPGAVVCPEPTAASAPLTIELPPGAECDREVAALCLMWTRDGVRSLALDLHGWTGDRIGSMELEVNAQASGSEMEFACPTRTVRLAKQGRASWSWAGQDVSPLEPLLLEFRSGGKGAVDALVLRTGTGPRAVLAWSTGAEEEPWLTADDSVFVAFDAAAEYGPGERVAAHELLEALLSALPVGCLSSVIGYDGSVKIEPSRLARHVPARAESMLAGLWRLDGPAGAGAAEFLRFSRMLASAGEGKALLVLVTGQRALSAPDQEAAALHAQNVRVAVLHVGGGGGRRLLDSGKETAADMVLECPGRTAPWVPAFDLLSNLNWPVLRDVALDLEGQASGVILTAGSGLASQPVVAVISMPQGQGAVRGAFRAVAGSQRPTAVFEASPEVDAALDGRLADELVSDLK